jgi:hypothetical protein
MSEARANAGSAGKGAAGTGPTTRPGPGDDDALDDTSAPPPSWREDWRAALSQGDEKRAKQLERFSTPEAVAKALFDTRERLSRNRAAPEPPEEATELELAQWRKQAGIPETPDGYEIAFPKEIEPSENDKAELAGFLKFMHDKHVAPRAAQAAFEFYMNARSQGAERMAQASEEATLDHLAELRKTYPGREYKRNIGLAALPQRHLKDPTPRRNSTRSRRTAAQTATSSRPSSRPRFDSPQGRHRRSISGDSGGGALDRRGIQELAGKPWLTDQERQRSGARQARIKREGGPPQGERLQPSRYRLAAGNSQQCACSSCSS